MNLARYRSLFLDEAREHVRALAAELERDGPASPEQVDSLFRHAHSIKGMAASMGFDPIRDLAHAMEDRLGEVRKGLASLEGMLAGRLLAASDALAGQIESVARDEPLAPAAELIGRLRAPLRAPPAAPQVEAAPQLVIEPVVAPSSPPGDRPGAEAAARGTLRVPARFLDSLLERVTELMLAQGTLRAAAGAVPGELARRGLAELRRSVERLREDTFALRLTPFSMLTGDLARAAREAGAATGKSVRFRIEDSEVSLDRAVVEALLDPLVHLVRNAIDHGIESAGDRIRAGKQAEGRLGVSVRREADSVYIHVEDDGRGMDPGRLVERAVAEGRIGREESERMSPGEKLMLATLPGLSTAAAVTHLSGRGVGLDLVRARIEGLGGKLEIASEPGRGTEIRLRAPLTLALQRLFLVRALGRRFAVPVPRVAGLVELKPGEVVREGRQAWARLDDQESMPLRFLNEVLGGEAPPPARALAGLILEARGKRVMLGVEEALAEAELVVRPLGRPLQRLRQFSGAAILNEGELALILDADELVGE